MELDGRYTFYRTLIIILTLLGLFLLWRLAEIVIVLFGAIIFASAIRPAVNRMARWRIPKGMAILLIYCGVLVAFSLLVAIAIPPLFKVVRDLLQDDGLIYRFAGIAYTWGERLGYGDLAMGTVLRLPEQGALVQQQLGADFSERWPGLVAAVAGSIGQLVLAFVMAFYWLTARDRIQGLLISMTPVRHRGRGETIFNDVERTLGDFVRGTVILMFSIGISAFVGLYLLGVPNALALALLAGLFEAIPMVGAPLGAVPAALVAFSVSPTLGLLTILLFAAIQFLEGNVLVPRVMEHSVGLNPLVVIIALVAGGSLKGIIGALLAIPVAGALQIIVRHLVVNPMVEEANHRHMEKGIMIFEKEDDDEDDEDQHRVIIAHS